MLDTLASLATALMLVVVVFQMRRDGNRDRRNVEDGFAREYRDLVAVLPVQAMLGQTVPTALSDDQRLAFYRYFDLCNQQAFMFKKGRIGEEVWRDWLEGIRDNLKLAAFKNAWDEIKRCRADSFEELRALEAQGFKFIPEPRGCRRWIAAR